MGVICDIIKLSGAIRRAANPNSRRPSLASESLVSFNFVAAALLARRGAQTKSSPAMSSAGVVVVDVDVDVVVVMVAPPKLTAIVARKPLWKLKVASPSLMGIDSQLISRLPLADCKQTACPFIVSCLATNAREFDS